MWNLLIRVLLIFVLSVFRVPVGTESQLWGYDNTDPFGVLGPNKWSQMPDSMCGGWRQSPVNIDTKTVLRSLQLPPIMLENIAPSTPSDPPFRLENEGYKVALYFNSGGWKINFLNSDACISLDHVHWHWGRNNSFGSEHMINGKSYPIEAHFVGWNCRMYKEMAQARIGPEGLYVFGVFYKVVPESKGNRSIMEELSKLFTQTVLLKKTDPYGVNPNKTIPSFDLSKLFPKNMDKYYRYMGSLTTPNCFENVVWTIFSEPLGITESQLNRFRSIQFGAPLNTAMVDNFRPVRLLNTGRADSVQRIILSSFSGASCCTMCTSVTTICLLISIFRELVAHSNL